MSALYRHRRTLLAAAAGLLLAPPLAIMAAPARPAVGGQPHHRLAERGLLGEPGRGGVALRRRARRSRTPPPRQSLPLSNGSLGVAAWAAGGFTAQLNRSDTMPYRLSPGQVQIPGLAAMTSASNFTGTLDLYNGVLDESGGGMTMQAWVPAGKDELIVNVTGASPGATADRDAAACGAAARPTAAASGAIGSLAQTWADNSQTGSSGQTFGAMAAITAGGQNVTASVVNSTQVQVSFTPNSDGSFRVIVAVALVDRRQRRRPPPPA